MSQSESFDAFYARTSWNVTSQVHALTGEDPLADHAIREAYAKAYQQWYEVSAYPDPEAWVLDVANDAYQRRLAAAAAQSDPAPPTGHDPLSWPGMFRSARPGAQPRSDPDATVGPRLAGPASPEDFGRVSADTGPLTGDVAGVSPAGGSPAGGSPAAAPAQVPPGSLFGGRPPGRPPASGAAAAGGLASGATIDGATSDWFAPGSRDALGRGAEHGDPTVGWSGQFSATPTAAMSEQAAAATTSGQPGLPRLSRPLGELMPRILGSRRNLIAVATVVVVLLAGGLYFALSGGKPTHAATPPAKPPAAKPTIHMLAAGQTGDRAAIPWSLVGPGWTLAEVSTAQPASNGVATGGDRVTYLMDPEGGRYRIRTMSGVAAPILEAWSGDAREALYAGGAGTGGGAASYSLLTLHSGVLTHVALPAGVTAVGFTRPDGLNILAVRLQNSRYRLERYDLAGAYQATVSTLPRPAGPVALTQVNALSSPDGTTDVWGVSGDGMELVSNAGGLIRKLRVPSAGAPKSCTPVNWWTANSVLTYCNAAGQPDAGRLWLVPAGGGQPTRLTGISGSPSGQGGITGAWQIGGAVYITSTTGAQCQGAPSGPGGQQILQLASGGAETAVTIPKTTNNHADIVSGLGGRLLVLAQTSCPGTSSLIWFNPATHTADPVLPAPPTEAGVVSAVPYSSGPVAVGG
jgi:hypothetical protein